MPELTEGERDARALPLLRDALAELALGVAVFAVLGAIGALVWWQVAPLAEFTRTTDNGSMDEAQLGVLVDADGWFATIAAAGGLLGGVGLVAWRGRRPVLAVVAVAVGGFAAWAVMTWLGRELGPPDPATVLPHLRVGDTVPVQLETHAATVRYVWSAVALLGAVGVLWGTDRRPQEMRETDNRAALSG